jgi:hypothetical protein
MQVTRMNVYLKISSICKRTGNYSFYPEVFQSIVFIHREAILKKLIVHNHVSTN